MVPEILPSEEEMTFPQMMDYITKWQGEYSPLQRRSVVCVAMSNGCDDGVVRLYGYGCLENETSSSIIFCDLPLEPSNGSALLWKPLVEPFAVKEGPLSSEEELLRERLRCFDSSFLLGDYSARLNAFLYAFRGGVMKFTDSIRHGTSKMEKLLEEGSSAMTPLFCPTQPDLFCYVSKFEVYVSNGKTTAKPDHTNGDNWRYGMPPFVVQEEFNRTTGTWWCPKAADNATYLLVEAYNESNVQKVTLGCRQVNAVEQESMHYPFAGSANAAWDLKLYVVHYENEELNVIELSLLASLSTLYPWAEYMTQCGWSPDGSFVWIKLMDRLQRRTNLIAVSPEFFIHDLEAKKEDSSQATVSLLYEEVGDSWLPITKSLVFLDCVQSNECRFIWMSRRSGYAHFYLITSRLSNQAQAAHVSSQLQITDGTWEASVNSSIIVDQKRGLIYFLASTGDAIESHVYATGYEKKWRQPVQLTQSGYNYGSSKSRAFVMNDDLTVLATFRSRVSEPGECIVLYLRFEKDNDDDDDQGGVCVKVCAQATVSLMSPSNLAIGAQLLPFLPPEPLFTQVTRGDLAFNSFLYRPHNFQPDQTYPTVLWIYGGPCFQLVLNAWPRQIFLPLCLSRGYAVLWVDGRGSANRGEKLETASSNQLGCVEIEDQVEVLESVKEMHGTIDLARVALMGWSYGGYMALMGLIQRPDIFKVAIAGAPVTDWSLYDTAYTERYLGLPEENGDSYTRSSVLTYVDKLPSTEGRLLILHGLKDENVHFGHTASLLRAMVEKGKPYSLQVYANERHAFREHCSSIHMLTSVFCFLQRNL